MDNTESDDSILAHIYGAALGQEHWQDLLRALERKLPGVRFGLWGHDLQANRNIGLLHQGWDPGRMAAWAEYYSRINPWAPGLAKAPVGLPVAAERVLVREELVGTEYYNDWLRPQEDVITGVGLILCAEPERFLTLTTNIRAADEERRMPEASRLLHRLAPHLTRAFEINRAIRARLDPKAMEAALEAAAGAAVVLDGSGRSCCHNTAAAQMLAHSSVVALDAAGRLEFIDPAAQRLMDQSVRAAARSLFPGVPATFPAAGSEGQQLKVQVIPLRTEPSAADPAAHFGTSKAPSMLVLMQHVKAAEQPVQRLLMEQFRLTQTECNLVLAVCRGEQLGAIATQREVSIHTVRNQLKSVFGKTGVNSQTRLVALLLSRMTQPGD